MFTGIVEEMGTVAAVSAAAGGIRIAIDAAVVLEDCHIGDSISVNGCCLTVVELDTTRWAADVQVESIRCTALGSLSPGDPVNLERPLRMGDRLGGHLVAGHVDATGEVVERVEEADGSVVMRLRTPGSVLRFVVEKGSVTVDGVSLTVASVFDDGFSTALIPHTLEVTTLGRRAIGDAVNLEADMVAKYVERFVSPATEESQS